MNLFTNGQAAMFYMGSWEMSMATSQNIDAEIRDSLRMFTMPVLKDGVGTATDIAAWNGGGHSVSTNGAQKDEANKTRNIFPECLKSNRKKPSEYRQGLESK